MPLHAVDDISDPLINLKEFEVNDNEAESLDNSNFPNIVESSNNMFHYLIRHNDVQIQPLTFIFLCSLNPRDLLLVFQSLIVVIKLLGISFIIYQL